MTGTISGAAVGRIGGLVIGGLAAMNFGEEGIRVGVALTALARGAGAGGVGGTLSFLGLCGAGGGGGNVRPGGGPGGSFGTLYRAPLTAGGGPGGSFGTLGGTLGSACACFNTPNLVSDGFVS